MVKPDLVKWKQSLFLITAFCGMLLKIMLSDILEKTKRQNVEWQTMALMRFSI